MWLYYTKHMYLLCEFTCVSHIIIHRRFCGHLLILFVAIVVVVVLVLLITCVCVRDFCSKLTIRNFCDYNPKNGPSIFASIQSQSRHSNSTPNVSSLGNWDNSHKAEVTMVVSGVGEDVKGSSLIILIHFDG